MDRRTRSRRAVVRAAGATAASALLAGCGGPGELAGGDDEETDPDAWENVDSISLRARVDGWTGVEPATIEGEDNPTLVLTEGREYEVTWENMDGEWHNFGARGDDEEWLVSSESIREAGETQTVTVEPSADMNEYLCEHHVDTMVGDVEVRTE